MGGSEAGDGEEEACRCWVAKDFLTKEEDSGFLLGEWGAMEGLCERMLGL